MKCAKWSQPGAGYKIDNFLAGRVSMMICGPWNLGALKSQHNVTYGAIFLPKGKVRATDLGGENLYLFKQHFEAISIEEAAKIDGASRWKTLWKIILPISRAPAVTLFLLTFIAEWNDLFKPLIFTSSEAMGTVQLGLTVFQDQFSTNYTLLMAAVLFVTAPVLLLFLVGQRQFIEGIARTGAKG